MRNKFSQDFTEENFNVMKQLINPKKDKETFIDKLKDNLEGKELPEHVKKVI